MKNRDKNYKNSGWLYQKYWEDDLSSYKIAQMAGVSHATILREMKKFGIPRRNSSECRRGKRNSNWKGGRVITAQGYVLIYQPSHPYSTKQGYILEHRIIVEKTLGRYLRSDEFIHHINSKRDDNRLQNLELVDRHKRQLCLRCGWPMRNLTF